jgi:D-methionine transport system substrate-binding protein
LAGCGGGRKGNDTAEKREIVVGVGANPAYGDMCRHAIEPVLAKKGYKVRYHLLGESRLLNTIIADGTVDLYVGQHEANLSYMQEHDAKLADVVPFVTIPSAVDAIYSNRLKARNRKEFLEEIRPGAVVTVPYSPHDYSRTLNFLEDLGLIRLREGIRREYATELDIVENPSGIVIKQVDDPLLPRTLNEVDFSIISGQEAEYAGIFGRGIAREINTTPWWQIIYAIHRKNLDTQWARDFLEAVYSEEFRDVIEDPQYHYHIYVKPAWYVEKWGLPSNRPIDGYDF